MAVELAGVASFVNYRCRIIEVAADGEEVLRGVETVNVEDSLASFADTLARRFNHPLNALKLELMHSPNDIEEIDVTSLDPLSSLNLHVEPIHTFRVSVRGGDGDEYDAKETETGKQLGQRRQRDPEDSLTEEGGLSTRRRSSDDDDLTQGSTKTRRTGWSGEKDGYTTGTSTSTGTTTNGVTYGPASPYTSSSYSSYSSHRAAGYVGLANQGATCYLNSLLQSLYMTPEFRNALYRWQPEGGAEAETSSIPLELQRLFLTLQEGKVSYAETTAVTKSFGWDGAEAFQQHDVQELLRVLFDALETEWTDTPLAKTIQDLYQGELKDYVRCLACGNESARNDKFMDVPLVIRPFGSEDCLGSVQESLDKFIEVERLDGDNQYECSHCKCKQDADKGLKFAQLPYILTFQIKRFDFDYVYFRRIKLNDKFSFPLELDMSSYMPRSSAAAEGDADTSTEDALGMHDSEPGVADNGGQKGQGAGDGAGETVVEPFDESEATNSSDDEGAESDPPAYSRLPTTSDALTEDPFEGDAAARQQALKNGMLYELFSIMIHSGSALGGHYYAYIKDFKTGKWLCFNDSSVTEIDVSFVLSPGPSMTMSSLEKRSLTLCEPPLQFERLRGAFGGASMPRYGSSMYSSSSSGYMLLYRRVDSDRNELPVAMSDLPPELLEQRDASRRAQQAAEAEEKAKRNQVELSTYFCKFGAASDDKKIISVDRLSSTADAFVKALEAWEIPESVPRSHFRIFKYTPYNESISDELQISDDLTIEKAGMRVYSASNVLIVQANDEGNFEPLVVPGVRITMTVYRSKTHSWLPPVKFCLPKNGNTSGIVERLCQFYHCDAEIVRICQYRAMHEPSCLKKNISFTMAGIYGGDNLFADLEPAEEDLGELPFKETTFYKAVETLRHTVEFEIELPHGDVKTMVIDTRDTLQTFKERIREAFLSDKELDDFQMWYFRSLHSRSEIQIQKLSQTVDAAGVDISKKVFIKEGKPLKEGESHVDFFLMSDDHNRSLIPLSGQVPLQERSDADAMFEMVRGLIRAKAAEIEEQRAKEESSAPSGTTSDVSEAATPAATDSPAGERADETDLMITLETQRQRDDWILEHAQNLEHMRIWETSSQLQLRTVYQPGDKIGLLYDGKKFLVELLDEDVHTAQGEIIVFYRQWDATRYRLGPLCDMVISSSLSIEQLLEKVSELYDIPVPELNIQAGPTCYPYIERPSRASYFPPRVAAMTASISAWPLSLLAHGKSFYFKDKRQSVKDVSDKDTAVLDRRWMTMESRIQHMVASTSSYVARPEVGVKIKTSKQRRTASNDVDEATDSKVGVELKSNNQVDEATG